MRMLVAFDNTLTEGSLHYRVFNLEENRVESWKFFEHTIMSKEEYLWWKHECTTVLEVNCQLDREEIIKCLYETYPELLL